jgi:hypothetical protein
MAETHTPRICAECGASAPSSKPVCSLLCQKAAAYRAMRVKYENELRTRGRVLRACSRCRTTVAAKRGNWPFSHGSPSGTLCMRCFKARQGEVDERARASRANSPVQQLRCVLVQARHLQRHLGGADAALRAGAEVINAAADRVVAELRAAVEDPASDFHQEALELLAGRILPLPAISKAAVQLARGGALDSANGRAPGDAPRFVVTVALTHGPEKK